MSILQIYDTGSGYKLVNPETTETGGTTGGTSGNVSLDLTTSRNFEVTASGSITWTFANPPSGSKLTTTFKLSLTNGGLGSQTWPAGVVWTGGSSPSLKTSGTNILEFTTNDGGTTWYGKDLTAVSNVKVTSANFSSTGFSLDVSKITEFSLFMISSAVVSNNFLTQPKLEYSNNGGTTWTTLQSLSEFITCFSTGGGAWTCQEIFAKFRFYYYGTKWYMSAELLPCDGQNIWADSGPVYVVAPFYYKGWGITFTPTASTIYRFNFPQGTWTFSNIIQVTS